MPDAETTIFHTIEVLVRRRQDADVVVTLDADIYDDLELDSLEVAELSAVLEDALGKDPYSEGIVPRTVGEVVEFYRV